jgi:hypothetical protein
MQLGGAAPPPPAYKRRKETNTHFNIFFFMSIKYLLLNPEQFCPLNRWAPKTIDILTQSVY